MIRNMRVPRGCRAPLALPLMWLSTVALCCALGLVNGAFLGLLAREHLPLEDLQESHEVVGDLPPAVQYRASSPRATEQVLESMPAPSGSRPDPLVTQALPTAAAARMSLPDLPSDQTMRTPASRQESSPTLAARPSVRGLPANQPLRPATRLVVPSLGVDAPVVLIGLRDGMWPVGHLSQEIGHLQGTASPGDVSNVVMAGHVTLAQGDDGPFRNLMQLKRSDEIWVYVGDEMHRYLVEYVRVVSPENVEVTFPTQEPKLTLITCANWNQALHVYDERIVAVASLVQ